MSKTLYAFVFLLFGIVPYFFAQDTTITMAPPMSEAELQVLRDQQVNSHARVYVRAMNLGDLPTAISALHYLMVEQPDNRHYQDSLLALYYRTSNFVACQRLGEEIVVENPTDNFALGILAELYSRGGQTKNALTCFENLEKNTQAPYYTYQVAVMRFQLERFGECREAINKLLSIPKEDDVRIRIFSDKQEQIVPIQAAALNLKGNLELKLGKKEAAKADFEKALEIAPDFLLPKGNLDQMDP